MLDWRTLLFGVVVFAATLAGGMWFGVATLPPGIGDWIAAFRAAPAVAAVRAVSAPQNAAASVRDHGKGLTNDRLAQAVILRAKAYLKPACNTDPKTLYVIAATNYAEVLMRVAGCGQFPKCALGESYLDDVWQRHRSALDRQVAEAMASVNAAGGLTEKRFRGDVGRTVRVIAGRDFAQGPAPACTTSQSRRRARIRWSR